MPHGGEPTAGEDLLPSDEIKVFKEEGDEDEHQSSENLTEVKTSLVTEGEEVRMLFLNISSLLACLRQLWNF